MNKEMEFFEKVLKGECENSLRGKLESNLPKEILRLIGVLEGDWQNPYKYTRALNRLRELGFEPVFAEEQQS